MSAQSTNDRVAIRGCTLILICLLLLGAGVGFHAPAKVVFSGRLACVSLAVVGCLVMALLLDSAGQRPDSQQPDIPASVLDAAQQRFNAMSHAHHLADNRVKPGRQDQIV
jgi:hypothetical protein